MKRALSLFALLACASAAPAQDFYDIDVLRTVDLDFEDANWWTLLQQNYVSQTNILADLTVDGVVYPDVGVRIRGNTSFLALPPGSQKVSLNISVDFVDPDQEVMGHDSLNFNNAFLDPTFCREVVYHNILSDWIPSGRANHIHLTLEGDDWGIYANVQQFGKEMLRDYFEDEDGMRVKCANNPNGPGLQYQGPNPGAYSIYEIKNDGGLVDPVSEVIAICNAVNNTPAGSWPLIDETVAIDPSIWSAVFENLFSDDDSYVNKGCDFVMYRNPIDGRTHLLQTDANETWTDDGWTATHNFNQGNKPFLSNVLGSSIMRGRYFAHMRTALAELDPVALEAEFAARRTLIESNVQADPKKLYSYQDFLDNFDDSVNLTGPFSGPVVGLLEYVNNRRTLLLADPELTANAPVITDVEATEAIPGMPVFITANVTAVDGVTGVDLWVRPTPADTYARVRMFDDGLSGDGTAGDNVYGVELPFVPVGGQQVAYYVGAFAQNAFRSQTFSPERTELDPATLIFQAVPGASDVVINEFLASNDTVIADETGSFEDYIELYNKSAATVDLSGMFMSDSLSDSTEWEIPAGTMLAPGATLLIWADEDLTDGPYHADFKLSKGGDDITLWDSDGRTLLDSITYGQQETDISTGSLEDGGTLRVTFPVPTPDALNDDGCGLRLYDQLDPNAHPLDFQVGGTGAVGTALAFTSTGFAPSTTAFLVFDFSPAHVTFGTNGLVSLTGATTIINTAVDMSGTLTSNLGIPMSMGLIDLDVFFQTAGTDAVSGVLSGSNGVHLTICP